MTEDDLIEEHYRNVLQHLVSDFGNCLDCGICCRFPTVGVSPKEISTMAKYLDISPGAFRRKYIVSVEGKQVIRHCEEGDCSDCVFLGPKDNKCRIYEARPYPCRTFPFDVQLKEGTVEIRYVELCPIATNFFSGFLEFIKAYYPHTYARINKILSEGKPDKDGAIHVTFPNVIINQYMFWLLMEDKNGY